MLKEIESFTRKLDEEKSVISNIMQRHLWLEKYKDVSKTVYPLFLFFDDFETRNGLGSHAGEEKLSGVYVSLACLPPHLSAKLRNIFISCIFRSKYLKQFGNQKLFSKTIEELNYLSEHEIDINSNGAIKTIYFECVLVLGDNLGLNCICGFTEGFKAKYFCRVCSVSNDLSACMFFEDQSLVRTVKLYENDVLKSNFSETGIKERCIFNALNKFHITENVTLDLMHDFFEGIAVYTVGQVLQALIEQKIISLEVINNRIENFNYTDFEKRNKPRPLFFTNAKGGKESKLKQSASEMLCLSRYLGLMIGDLVPTKNKHWKLYRCLRKIIGIITAPQLTINQMYDIQDLAIKHNSLYFELFGKLKPKMHFFVHYARIMISNGPVIHFSAMKFERKNKELKEVVTGTNSNVNLPWTIGIRHQLKLCYFVECYQHDLVNDVLLRPSIDCNAFAILHQMIPGIDQTLNVQMLQNVEIRGKKFTKGTLLLQKSTDEGPQFGQLK